MGTRPTNSPRYNTSETTQRALRPGLQGAHVIHEIPAIAAPHLVPVDGHEPPAHHLATDDDRVEVAVGAPGDRVVHERAHPEEGPSRRRRDRAVPPPHLSVAGEPTRLAAESAPVGGHRG